MDDTPGPTHNGHLVAVSKVTDRFDLDLVLLVPTGEPQQKRSRKVSHSEDRYLVTTIITASNPQFSISQVDIDRPSTTYTVDTLRGLKVMYLDVNLFFITGADALQKITTRRGWGEMFDAATLVDVTRPGIHLRAEGLEGIDASRLYLIETLTMAISSTGCRKRVETGRPAWYLVPDGVV